MNQRLKGWGPKLFLAFSVLLVLFFANNFFVLEYNMSLMSYIRGDSWLTESEKEYLKNRGELIYGADENSPPLRYVNPQTGQYEGLVIDYLSALSMELGVNIKTKPMVWNEALAALARGQTDLCDLYPSKERSKYYAFTEPIYYQRGAILIRRDEKRIKMAKNLEGKRIAAIQGDYVFEYLKSHYNQVATVPTTDTRTAIHLLELGEVDAVLGDESVLNYYLNSEGLSNTYVILDDYLYELEAVIGVPKSQENLAKILNKAIYRLNRQNTMNRIYEKWFSKAPLITKSNQERRTVLLIEMILALGTLIAFLMYYVNRQLANEVKRQTQALSQSNEELEQAFSEYRLAESKMLQSTKMAAVGQLAAGVAHEIRTPLGIIRNGLYLLKRADDPQTRNRQMEAMEQSVDRANRIIESLLNFSRISEDIAEAVDLNEFIDSLWLINHKAWQSQNIHFEATGHLEKKVFVFQESLKHILLNLFSNAVDAMPNGGKLSVQVSADELSKEVTISVSDTGMGISKEQLEKLFDPFYTTKPAGRGTGLGLYIVYNEVQKINASIQVDSVVGSGSCFSITLHQVAFKTTEDARGDQKGE